jgi:hypothetical protein
MSIPVPPPPQPPDYGLSPSEFARYHRKACAYSRMRLLDAGAREYDEADHQLIEEFDPHRILLELRQEVADAITYLVGLDLAIARWSDKIGEVE